MRLGFDVSPLVFPTPLGVVRATRGLVEALERRGFVEIVRLAPERSSSSLAWRHLELPRRVRALALDGLHSPVSAFPLSSEAPVVATVHEVPWLAGARERAGLAARFWASVPASAATLCPSAFTAHALARHRGFDGRVVVAPWGIDDVFAHDPRGTPALEGPAQPAASATRAARAAGAPSGDVDVEREPSTSDGSRRDRDDRARSALASWADEAALLERFGVHSQRFVLCPGATRAKKNVAAVVRGIAALDRIDVARLAIVVTGHPTDDSVRDRSLARSHGLGERFVELGVVSDAELASLYRSCACVAVLSHSEGFAFPVVEALAAGAPVLVPRASAAAEAAGSQGILVDVTEARAIALGVQEALASRDGRRSARRARAAEFTWDRCAARVEDLWRSLV